MLHLLPSIAATFLWAATTAAAADAAEIPSLSPTSSVTGKAFDRFITIWLENTDYAKAAGDPNLKWLAERGITLTNYFALTHPSQPNYVAAVGGDYFGLNHNGDISIASNTSTIVDLLEPAGISWASYQEGMPYTGFTGHEFNNPQTKANEYKRKHSGLVSYDSVAKNEKRLGLIKNDTLFHDDLDARKLPQWVFFTPDMRNNGHDTSVTFAGNWTRSFLEPLLDNEYFMNNTLILVTFDENHSYTKQNRVFTILMGGAVPKESHGTIDDSYYDHYSEISTVCANWNLSTLGRYDVGANVFSLVAARTNDTVLPHPDLSNVYLNDSYPGPFHKTRWAPEPLPNISLVVNGREVAQSIKNEVRDKQGMTPYNGSLVIPDRRHPPVGMANGYGTPQAGEGVGGNGTDAQRSGAGRSSSSAPDIGRLVPVAWAVVFATTTWVGGFW